MEKSLQSFLQTNESWTVKDAKLHREYSFSDFIEAFAFMTEIALFAEQTNHHPEWFNVYKNVIVDLTTHELGGISEKDITLATKMETVAATKNTGE